MEFYFILSVGTLKKLSHDEVHLKKMRFCFSMTFIMDFQSANYFTEKNRSNKKQDCLLLVGCHHDVMKSPEVLPNLLSYHNYNISHLVGKPTMWFPNRSDTNRPVQAQKRARSLKFRI